MNKRSMEVSVGFFVLLGMLGLAFLALKAANLGSAGGGDVYAVTAKFDNIGGLKAKAAVKSAGVVVGRVSHIGFDDKKFQAQIAIDMDPRFAFPKDSSLKILTSGLLGEQYIGIEAGADEKNLAAGDNVGTTQSAVVLENLISQFLYNSAASSGGGAKPPANGAK